MSILEEVWIGQLLALQFDRIMAAILQYRQEVGHHAPSDCIHVQSNDEFFLGKKIIFSPILLFHLLLFFSTLLYALASNLFTMH